MTRGRKPKSKAELKATNAWKPSRHGGRMQADPCIPEPPDWLNEEGRAYWCRVVPQLAKSAGLSDIDFGMLAMLCQTWSECVQLHKFRNDPSFAILSQGRKNAALTALNEARNAYCKCAQEFGLSPVARMRVKVSDAKPSDSPTRKDKFGL